MSENKNENFNKQEQPIKPKMREKWKKVLAQGFLCRFDVMMKQPSTEEWLADKKETSTKRKSRRPHHLDDFVTHPAPKS